MPEAQFLTDLKRTHDCGGLRASDAGKRAVLYGWVHARRDHGGCVFIDLRDRGGITQVVFEPTTGADAHAHASELRREFCVGIAGVVRERGGHKNPNLDTGISKSPQTRTHHLLDGGNAPLRIGDPTRARRFGSTPLPRPAQPQLQRNFKRGRRLPDPRRT